MKEVAQNARGDIYAMVYFNNGNFRLRTFTREERSEEFIRQMEVDINKLLNINDHTMPIQNFPDPFITCCFINDNLIFIQLYYVPTFMHYHFLWDLSTG